MAMGIIPGGRKAPSEFCSDQQDHIEDQNVRTARKLKNRSFLELIVNNPPP
jgi:hypothetical protein